MRRSHHSGTLDGTGGRNDDRGEGAGTMQGFYWLIEGKLAGCPRPGSRRERDAPQDGLDAPTPLDDDLVWLRERGIRAVLSLTETPLDVGAFARHDLAGLHLPVDDLHAPTPAQLHYALAFIDQQHARDRAVAVHCLMGQGRTGTVLAAHRIRGGSTTDDALRELRALSPGAIGSPVQEEALRAFARDRDWII
jgi:atypical dual specificity phosphatase